jgi:hypothetical protein
VLDYAFGMVAGFQPEIVQALLDDFAVGTPQRFAYTSCVDPSLPDAAPGWPGPLAVLLTPARHDIDPAICTELRRDDTARVRGQLRRNPLDAHEPLMRIKFAGLLALLDRREHITQDDWRLATIMWHTSRAVRDALVHYGRQRTRAKRRKEAAVHAEREVAKKRAVEEDDAAVERVARVIARCAWKTERTLAKRDLRDATAGRDRAKLDAAITCAVRQRWIEETDDVPMRYSRGKVEP